MSLAAPFNPAAHPKLQLQRHACTIGSSASCSSMRVERRYKLHRRALPHAQALLLSMHTVALLAFSVRVPIYSRGKIRLQELQCFISTEVDLISSQTRSNGIPARSQQQCRVEHGSRAGSNDSCLYAGVSKVIPVSLARCSFP